MESLRWGPAPSSWVSTGLEVALLGAVKLEAVKLVAVDVVAVVVAAELVAVEPVADDRVTTELVGLFELLEDCHHHFCCLPIVNDP